MPRIYTAKAGKDYPKEGIKKGDTYYWWKHFRSRMRHMSKTMPRRSQIQSSPTLASALAAEEAYEDAVGHADTVEDVVSAIQEAAGDANDVISEFEEKISNLEQAFPGGCPGLEEANEQRDNFQSWLDELETAASDVENLDDDEYKDEEDPAAAKLEAAKERAREVSLDL